MIVCVAIEPCSAREAACRGSARRGAARPASHACPVQILSAGVRAQINAIGRARTGPPVAGAPPGLSDDLKKG